mmetsp:Transcript_3447/g.9824  ORF Transcript_3447/g.9824 Transcript_3447/m.9824 type:complete len:211 (+) Transcript_3447:296-928(+)
MPTRSIAAVVVGGVQAGRVLPRRQCARLPIAVLVGGVPAGPRPPPRGGRRGSFAVTPRVHGMPAGPLLPPAVRGRALGLRRVLALAAVIVWRVDDPILGDPLLHGVGLITADRPIRLETAVLVSVLRAGSHMGDHLLAAAAVRALDGLLEQLVAHARPEHRVDLVGIRARVVREDLDPHGLHVGRPPHERDHRRVRFLHRLQEPPGVHVV